MTDDPEIAALRRTIDQLDDTLVELLARRLEVARALGARKARVGRDPAREAEVLDRLAAKGSLPPELISLIWRAFFEASDWVQRRDRQ